MPACTAAPYPGVGSATTQAPSDRATAAVPSEDPLSTTITPNTSGTLPRTSGRAPASFLHGRTRSQFVMARR